MITVTVDGVNRTVSQPSVNVDGVWKDVEKESVNVDGVWKTVFEKAKPVSVKLYQNGTLVQTLTCMQGESVTLPTLSPYSGNSFYGWGNGSTTLLHNGSTAITPTEDISLYAIFKVTVTLYKYGTYYSAVTGYTTGTKASVTLPSCAENSGDTFYGWTLTRGSTVKYYNGYTSYSLSSTMLHAIFSYVTAVPAIPVTVPSGSYTFPTSGTVVITNTSNNSLNFTSAGDVNHGGASSYDYTITVQFSTGNAMWNGTFPAQSEMYSCSVTAGSSVTSKQSGDGYSISIVFTPSGQTTNYRS